MEMQRSLASIRVISNLSPIEGADKIEKATIDGWSCVVQKGDFVIGDLCVYFEIDSFLPVIPEFEFLRKSCYRKLADGREGFRIKTIKLRGTVSQGLALPIMLLDRFKDRFCNLRAIQEDADYYPDSDQQDPITGFPVARFVKPIKMKKLGMDVTKELGVTKYDPPIPVEMKGKLRSFPGFLRKADQERIQNIWHKVKDREDTFEVTIKLDGMSCIYYYNDGKFGVCSKNFEIEEDENNTLWKIARKYDIENKLKNLRKNIAIYGEVVGEGIQGNKEKLIGQDFYLFDIFHINEFKYYEPSLRIGMNNAFLELKHVPIVHPFKVIKDFSSLEELLSFANGPSLNAPLREGVVFKANDYRLDLRFKVISNEFLLKEK